MAISRGDVARARDRGILDDEFDQSVDAGLLLCHSCKSWFPIARGLPVLLPYTTPVHERFAREFAQPIAVLSAAYAFPAEEPAPGEEFVLRSFSAEWLDYKFDGVIWEMDYRDHEARSLGEMGPYRPAPPGAFLEIGCGLGITTALAHRNFGVDAVGVDLSVAVMRAAAQYRENPFLHFVEASVFSLPFERGAFDAVYSRGVLHHTYSTREAFRALAAHCREGGFLYVWVYGPGSLDETLLRRGAYRLERMLRPVLSRRSPWVSTAALTPVALGYLAFNRWRRRENARIQRYNFRRALHAARDRFTPAYAHRQDHREVAEWFREAGFEAIEVVDWRAMPVADHDDYRRNTGVRGRRRR